MRTGTSILAGVLAAMLAPAAPALAWHDGDVAGSCGLGGGEIVAGPVIDHGTTGCALDGYIGDAAYAGDGGYVIEGGQHGYLDDGYYAVEGAGYGIIEDAAYGLPYGGIPAPTWSYDTIDPYALDGCGCGDGHYGGIIDAGVGFEAGVTVAEAGAEIGMAGDPAMEAGEPAMEMAEGEPMEAGEGDAALEPVAEAGPEVWLPW